MNKYIINVVPQEDSPYNPMHEIVQDKEAVVLEAEIGERGWIAYKLEDDIQTPWHRLHTSIIKNVRENDFQIAITTENTLYTLVKVGDEE